MGSCADGREEGTRLNEMSIVLSTSRVRGWRGARRVRCVYSARFRGGAQSGSHRSVSTPCPPNRTCGFPASGSPAGSCLSHAERRFGVTLAVPVACIPPASSSCTASPARWPSPSHRRACSRPGGTGPPFGPVPSLTHVMLRNSPPLRAGFVGNATPAGFRSSVIPPRLKPLPSAGITPRLQYYGPLRHPAGPACPSRGPGCRVHGADRASRVAALSIFHACRRHYPGGNRPVPIAALFPADRRPSPIDRRVGFRTMCFEACSAFTRVPACMVAEPPKTALLPRCFSPCRYLHEPPWPLPAGAIAGWDSHPPGKRAFPRRTVNHTLHRAMSSGVCR